MAGAGDGKPGASQALLCLYDAVGDPGGWESALDALVEASGCASAILTVGDRAPNANGLASPYELNAGSRLFRDKAPTIAEYFRQFSQREIEEFAFFRDAPPQQIRDDAFIYSDVAALKERDDFRFRRERVGLYRRFGVRLNDNRRWAETAFFQLGLEYEEIPAPIRDRVATFVPHMAKVVELGRTFVELRRRHRALLGVLDRVRVGLGLVRADGALILANEEARRVLEQARGLGLSRAGRLVFGDDAIAAAVAHAIAGAVRTASGTPDITEFRVCVGNDTMRGNRVKGAPEAGVLLEIAPMRDALDELSEPEQHALLTLIDPGRTAHVSTERLAIAYGLSAAESAVCRLLVAGRTQGEIAEIRRVGVETVKSQSRTILGKTDTRSRVELVALALRTSPPIDP